jgi:hypothetical protein
VPTLDLTSYVEKTTPPCDSRFNPMMARGPSYSECPRPVPSPCAHLASGGEEEAQAGCARQQRQEAPTVSQKKSSCGVSPSSLATMCFVRQ